MTLPTRYVINDLDLFKKNLRKEITDKLYENHSSITVKMYFDIDNSIRDYLNNKFKVAEF